MGKIRVMTLGDEESEKKQKEELKKKKEAKKLEKTADEKPSDVTVETSSSVEEKSNKKEKKEKFKIKKSQKHSKKYQSAIALVDKNKKYSLDEALELLPKLKIASFDESVELHLNLSETGISGAMTLPHGTGKKTRVVIINAAKDPKHAEEKIKDIESGKIDFDILIATPDSMPKLAKVAKILGPRGLMPNPKNGTVTPKPEEIAKNYEGGQINYKSEAKFPILHLVVGKQSFGDKKLKENIKHALSVLPNNKIKSITLKSTMSPGLKIQL